LRCKNNEESSFIWVGEVLLQRGTVSKQDLVSALSEVTTLPYIDCMAVQVSAETLKTIHADMARRRDVLPIKLQEGKLTVVMAEPQNLQLIDELRFKTGKVTGAHLFTVESHHNFREFCECATAAKPL
jgi:Type II secretion system (T2SS), protein E, N-terminal domain